jgi:oligopeptide transport system substrate-binding protein
VRITAGRNDRLGYSAKANRGGNRVKNTRSAAMAALMVGSLVAAACGSDKAAVETKAPTAPTTAETKAPETTVAATKPAETTAPAETKAPAAGGEFVDGAQFGGGRPAHIDPGFTSELDGAQVTTALYDGLTDFSNADPKGPVLKPLAAEKWVANADATQFVFTVKKGLKFSNGEDLLPSSFARGWNRAADPKLATDYSYLFALVKGYDEWAAEGSTATSLSGVVADDAAMTLTVDLAKPYADFPSVASHIIFAPMPKEVEALADQTTYEQGLMVGNGPFMMSSKLTDTELTLVPNPNWAGDVDGNKTVSISKLKFVISADIDSAYAAFEAGETMSASIPSGKFKSATDKYGNSATPLLGSYHFVIGMRTEDPLGGPDKAKLRQAISMAVDRAGINDSVYDGSRPLSTGVTPPGIPGFKEGLGKYTTFDLDGAKALLEEYTAGGGTIPDNIKITFNIGQGHEDVVALMQANLEELGVSAELDPREQKTYFKSLRDGGCPGVCRAGWFWDYPIYDNGMYDLFHVEAAGNNLGKYDSAEFNTTVDEARKTIDDAKRFELFQKAEDLLLNVDTAVIPITWYNGDHVFAENIKGYAQEALGWVRFEKITVG